ncbi:hypothetical protein V6Z11_A08G163600 [Gossypium hirsutum]
MIFFSRGKYRHVKEMYPLLAVDPGNDNIKTMVDGESRDAEDSTEKVLKTMYELWMLVERRSQRGKSDLRGYRGKDIEMEKLGLRVAALNGEGEVIGDESGIGEKFTGRTTIQNKGFDKTTTEIRAKENI